MKITKKNLEKIIKEEIEDVIKTVSINQLEYTITELSGSEREGPMRLKMGEDPTLVLAFDIRDGLKDDQLDNLWAEYGCAAANFDLTRSDEKKAARTCNVIKRRKKHLSLKKKKNED